MVPLYLLYCMQGNPARMLGVAGEYSSDSGSHGAEARMEGCEGMNRYTLERITSGSH